MSRIHPTGSIQRSEVSSKATSKLRTLAERVSSFAKEIDRQWEMLEPEALAAKIIDFKDQVAREQFPGVKKMRELADNYHFQFVFPIIRDLRVFAKSITRMAKEVLKTNSLIALSSLSVSQQKEILGGMS